MPHAEAALVSTIAVSLACAFLGGFVAVKLRLSPIVGYLLAGVVVGMLFDPVILITEPLKLLAVVAVIIIGEALTAIAIVLLLSQDGQNLILAGALISITLNPQIFWLAGRV